MNDTLRDKLQRALGASYAIERELGVGGMATVWLAHDRKHDRDVAIKVLHPELAAALGGDRFLSEIKTTARLQHPHILPLLDSGEADGLLYYVMPFATGETLRARLEREQQLPIDDALRIATEVADALGSAHAINIIHRDIKPENILLQGNHAVVADFGMALAVQQAGGARMTQTGLSLGTPQYMSPEQAVGERTIDARSDIYALGAVTYEMLVGEPPFTGPTVKAIVARLMTEEPRGICMQRKAVPAQVEAAVLHALEKLPADRFGSAAEFAAALHDRSMTSSGLAMPHADGMLPGVPRSAFRARRVAIIVAMAGASVAAGWFAARLGQGTPSHDGAPTITSVLAPLGGNFGEQRALALSPDGRRLAFVFSSADGARTLWVRDLGRLDAEPMPHTDDADAPFWSPDGRTLGYFAGGFLTVQDQNGDTRRLCPASIATGGSWSASGLILFGHRGGLSTVPAGGGVCRLVISRGAGFEPRGQFLPDGKRFLYSRGFLLDMAVADLDGKQLGTVPVRASEFSLAARGYVIAPSRNDSRAVDAQRIDYTSLSLTGPLIRPASAVRSQSGIHTFTVSQNGAFAFLPGGADRPYLEYDANGQLRDTVRVEGTWSLSVRPRAAGPPLVAVAGNAVGVWLYDLDTDRATKLLMHDSTAYVPNSGGGSTYPVSNANGSRLVYATIGPGWCRITERDLATDAERVVLESKAPSGNQCPLPFDWSNDGQRLLVRRDTSLVILPMHGGSESQEIVRPGRLLDGHFSPDGRSVAYSSAETGRAEVYVQTLPTGLPVRVSLEGGRWAAWSHGGTVLTFITPDGRVQEASLAGRNGAAAAPHTRFSIPSWRRSTFDDRGIGFAMVGDGERYLVRVSPSGLAVAYMQNWPALVRRADSSSAVVRR